MLQSSSLEFERPQCHSHEHRPLFPYLALDSFFCRSLKRKSKYLIISKNRCGGYDGNIFRNASE
jgi:hypothetical protein